MVGWQNAGRVRWLEDESCKMDALPLFASHSPLHYAKQVVMLSQSMWQVLCKH